MSTEHQPAPMVKVKTGVTYRDGRWVPVYGMRPAPEPEPSKWDQLLRLITDYGGERFVAGWRASIRETPIKTDSTGVHDGSEKLVAIVSMVERMRREAGDD